MVIAELDVEGVSAIEPETDTPLVVHGDGMLASAIAFEGVQAIAWRHPEIGHVRGDVDGLELAQGTPGDVDRDPLALARSKQFLCQPIRERLDHGEV